MKKIYMLSIAAIMLVVSIGFVASCKKDKKETGGCDACPECGGIKQIPTANITFYITKDLGCGNLKLSKIHNNTTGDEAYSAISGSIIDRYYSNVPPACGSNAAGTIVISVPRGYTYNYTFACSAQTYTGTFTTTCDNSCVSVEIK